MLDLRLSYLMQFDRGTTLDLSAEVFNVTNENTILRVDSNGGRWSWSTSKWWSSSLGRIDEVLSPRIVRLGARVTFR